MNGSVTIKSEIFLEMLDLLKNKGFLAIHKKLLLSIPMTFFKEGSTLWWERSELEADEDIKLDRVSKKYIEINSLIKDLSA